MNLEFERVENGVPGGDTVLNPFRIAIDEYCAGYKDIFKEVRSYEYFKYLILIY
jgi:hypothetical protein